MKQFYLVQLTIFLAFVPFMKGFSQCNLLVKTFGSTTDDNVNAMDSSPDGSVYFTGSFTGTINFGTYQLVTAGDQDIFIGKIDANGTVLWAKKAGGLFTDFAMDITVDNSGNAYISGRYKNSATFETQTILANGGDGAFIAKYNASGTLQWVRNTNGGFAKAIDYYNSKLFVLETGGYYSDTIIVYDSGTKNILSKKGLPDYANASQLKIDGSGNIFIGGSFYNDVNFGTQTISTNGNDDVYIAKYNNAMNFQWAKPGGGSNTEYLTNLYIDATGNVYSTGRFFGTSYFSSATINSSGEDDAYITKYDNNGNLSWVKSGGGSSYSDEGYSISGDNSGNIYLTGNKGSIPFSFDQLSLTTYDYNNFIVKFNSLGNVVDLTGLGGGHYNNIIHVNSAGKIFAGVNFNYDTNFGASKATTKGNYDIAIVKFNDFDDLRINTPEICIIVIDPATSKNKVVWDKPASTKISTFNIYRENAVGDYIKIATSPYAGNNYFVDNTSQPLQQSYAYKISLTDVCTNESEFSRDAHMTMHLQMYPGPNNVWSLLWTAYEGVDVEYYRIKRGTTANNLVAIDSVPSGFREIITYTDLTPPIGNVFYSVEAVTDASCSGLTRSNPSTNRVSFVSSTTGIMDAVSHSLTLYPNPNNGQFKLEWKNITPDNYSVKIMNNEGAVILNSPSDANNNLSTFDLSEYPKGLYHMEIEFDGNKVYKKVAVQ